MRARNVAFPACLILTRNNAGHSALLAQPIPTATFVALEAPDRQHLIGPFATDQAVGSQPPIATTPPTST
uniref:Uncharacterized protein n=1 Tax=Bionectria ochroleuca TaxID=29856 RepID=A0A8H7N7T9_BIOOC